MKDYDFSQLSDKEFEVLVVDLLSRKFGLSFERFKPGKDSGIDARAYVSGEVEVVVQCKHYLKSGVSTLLGSLKKNELPKIKKITPVRYILATSCPLSRKNKEEIVIALSPYCKNQSDVFGQEDLNDLLREFPKIEKAHVKLWMASFSALQRILSNDILGRSEEFIREISNKSKRFVATSDFDKAKEKIEESHVLILSGEPGVGKTTLAENLCLLYAASDFQIIEVIRDLSEAEKVFALGEKQIFIFDDFLGSNYLDAIDGREDSHVVKFIRRIANDPSKRFVLTTRTHILNQAISVSDIMRNGKIRRDEFLLKVAHLTPLEKAQILYNHLWHGEIKEGFAEEIHYDRRYMTVISHKNFNPRIIEFITDSVQLEALDTGDYWAFVLEMLDNPAAIWKQAFYIQGDDDIRLLIKLVVLAGGRLKEDSLERAFRRHENKVLKRDRIGLKNRFRRALESAARSFLNREITRNKEVFICLFNPSIADFILSEFSQDTDEIVRAFSALDTTESLFNLEALAEQKIINKTALEEVARALDSPEIKEDKDIDYRITLVGFIKNKKQKLERIDAIILEVQSDPIAFEQKVTFIEWLSMRFKFLDLGDFDFLVDCFSIYDMEFPSVVALAKLLKDASVPKSARVYDLWKDSLEEVLGGFAHEIANDMPLSEHIQYYSNDEGGYEVDYDAVDLRGGMRSGYEYYLAKLPDNARSIADKFRDIIIEDYDYSELVDDYLKAQTQEYDGRWSGGGHSGVNEPNDAAIHDLFQRS